MNNCVTHKKREAIAQCDACGDLICEQCRNVFELPDNEGNLCAECYKEAIRRESAEIGAIRSMVKRELILIILGMIAGFGYGLFLIVSALEGTDEVAAGFGIGFSIFALIYLPFLFGSLITIIKKAYHAYQEGKDESGNDGAMGLLSAIIIAAPLVVFAPITTIWRIVARVKDMRRLRGIEESNIAYLATVDNFIAQTTAPSLVEQTADGSFDSSHAVEISLESILGEDIVIGANGQVLRQIRSR